MVLSWQIVRFELKETFSISYGNYSHRNALLISLRSNTVTGYGECTAIDYYKINLEDYSQKLNSIKLIIDKSEIVHPTQFYDVLLTLNLPSFLRSALDCAYWDLYGKLEKKSFLDLNFIEVARLPESSITISVAPVANQLKKIAASSWTYFKVKCDHFNQEELTLLLTSEKKIALDANGSFLVDHCSWLEDNPSSAQFTYIEQPMKPNNFNSLHTTKFANWMADEDCQEGIDLNILKLHYSSINIKLVKCGGLTPALHLIKAAKKIGLKTMIGCMTESTVGISAGAMLAPLVDYVDLDGANLIANDIASGSRVVNGRIELNTKPGLGIAMV